jgi:hypothetical protein
MRTPARRLTWAGVALGVAWIGLAVARLFV